MNIRRSSDSNSYHNINYQGVKTKHNMLKMHEGRFHDINQKYWNLDPNYDDNITRLRHYNLCLFSNYVKNLEGDFITAGISYGVAPRIIYDFVKFEKLNKVYHFIDPFLGIGNDGDVNKSYNKSKQYVLDQYPKSAPIKLHNELIPNCFPLNGVDKISFAHLNTGVYLAEAKSLKYLFDKLIKGGVIIIDNYSLFNGYEKMKIYDPFIKELEVEIFVLVTGQGVILKKF